MNDPVNHPSHYTSHPSGVECLTVVRHMGFNLGNAVKYIWRAGLKSPDPVQDLEKAVFYLQDEIKRLREPAEKKAFETLRAMDDSLRVKGLTFTAPPPIEPPHNWGNGVTKPLVPGGEQNDLPRVPRFDTAEAGDFQ